MAEIGELIPGRRGKIRIRLCGKRAKLIIIALCTDHQKIKTGTLKMVKSLELVDVAPIAIAIKPDFVQQNKLP